METEKGRNCHVLKKVVIINYCFISNIFLIKLPFESIPDQEFLSSMHSEDVFDYMSL